MVAIDVLLFCRIVVGLVFAISAVGKARDMASFREAITDFRLLPRSWSKVLAWSFLAGEGIVVLLVTRGGEWLTVGFALASFLLTVFSIALLIVVIRNQTITCNCFGRTARPVSPYDIARNMLILAWGMIGMTFIGQVLPTPLVAESILIGVMAISYVALATNLADIVETICRPLPTTFD